VKSAPLTPWSGWSGPSRELVRPAPSRCFLKEITDQVSFPCTASLVGMPVVVTAVDFDGDERRGLVAAVERDRTSVTVCLLDLEVTGAEPTLARPVTAYQRWLGVA
jgi:hypothetical protein